MSYLRAVTARHVAGRAVKPRGSPVVIETEREAFPFYYALVMALFFLLLTKGKSEFILPSIVIPLVLWLFVKHRG
jgi:hypothetical protein